MAMSTSPYTEDDVRCFRLSALIVNVGTEAARKLFNDDISTRYSGNLPAALTNLKKKILNGQQKVILFPAPPDVPNSDDFDLTLLVLLFRNLGYPPPTTTGNWDIYPTSADSSTSANLLRLKKIRNTVYAHISSTKLTQADFDIHWTEMENILLGLDPTLTSDIDKYKTEDLSQSQYQKYEDYKTQIKQLMENDTKDLQCMFHTLQNLVKEQPVMFRTQLSDIQKSLGQITEDDPTPVLALLKKLPAETSRVIIQSLNKSATDIISCVKEEADSVRDCVTKEGDSGRAHTTAQTDSMKAHVTKEGDSGRAHTTAQTDSMKAHVTKEGDSGRAHTTAQTDSMKAHVTKEGDSGRAHTTAQTDSMKAHVTKEGDSGRAHTTAQTDSMKAHVTKEGDSGRAHTTAQTDSMKAHVTIEGDSGRAHTTAQTDSMKAHATKEGDSGRAHTTAQTDSMKAHVTKEGDSGRAHTTAQTDSMKAHVTKEGDSGRANTTAQTDSMKAHVTKEGDSGRAHTTAQTDSMKVHTTNVGDTVIEALRRPDDDRGGGPWWYRLFWSLVCLISGYDRKKQLQQNIIQDYLQDVSSALKSYYGKRYKKIPFIPWNDTSHIPIDDIYVPLKLEENKDEQEKEVTGETFKNIEELISKHCRKDGVREIPVKLIIQGKPGSGKSTTFYKLVYNWTKSDSVLWDRYELVILLKARDFSPDQDLFKAITNTIPDYNEDNCKELSNILRQKKVLIIIDGYDELGDKKNQTQLNKLLDGTLYHKCDLIVTTRHWCTDHLKKRGGFDEIFTVCDFDNEDTKSYVSKFFTHYVKNENKDVVKNFISEVSEKNIKNLLKQPLTCLFLCIVWQEKGGGEKLPETRAQIYDQVIQVMKETYKKKVGDEFMDDTFNTLLNSLSKLAFEKLVKEHGILQFERKDLEDIYRIDVELACAIGILVKADPPAAGKKTLMVCDYYTFPLLTFQEFLGARYLYYSEVDLDQAFKAMYTGNQSKSYDNMYDFFFGHMSIESDKDITGKLDGVNQMANLTYKDIQFKGEMAIQQLEASGGNDRLEWAGIIRKCLDILQSVEQEHNRFPIYLMWFLQFLTHSSHLDDNASVYAVFVRNAWIWTDCNQEFTAENIGIFISLKVLCKIKV